jgi:predicted negative regulator of RcsB-dependent stress response
LETYNSDEQLQLLRQWLRDNGPALLAGILLGAALIAGWSGWKLYVTRQAQQASTEFEHLREVLQSGDAKHAAEITNRLTTNYSRTPYAAMAALMLAADQVKHNQFDAALPQYLWVTEHANDRKLRQVARLRRARLLWSMGRSEEALAALQARRPGSFAPLFAELRGDILAGQGRRDEARQAYTEALAAEGSAPEQRAAIELKLNDLNSQEPVAAANPPAAPKGD